MHLVLDKLFKIICCLFLNFVGEMSNDNTLLRQHLRSATQRKLIVPLYRPNGFFYEILTIMNALEIFLSMHYINLHFTYSLTKRLSDAFARAVAVATVG